MVSPAAEDTHTPPSPGTLRPWVRLALLSAVLWAIWSAASIWLLSPETLDETIGETAPFDVQAPRELTYLSEVETEAARDQAAAAVRDIYTAPDPKVLVAQAQSLVQILRYITVLRDDQFLSDDQRVDMLIEIPALELERLQANSLGGRNRLTDEQWAAVQLEASRLLEIGLRQSVREDTIEDSRRSLELLVDKSLPEEQGELAGYLAGRLLAANSFLDEAATESARQAAREAVQPIEVHIRQGETIIRQGILITPLAYEKLGELGYLDSDVDWRGVTKGTVSSALLVATLAVYISRARPGILAHPRRLTLFYVLIAGLAITAPWVIPGHILLPYVYPVAGVAMLISLFLGTDLAMLMVVVTTTMVGLASDGSMELIVYTLLGGIVGSLALSKTEQLSRFVQAGLLLMMSNLAVILCFRISDLALNARGVAELCGAAMLNSALSTSLSFLGYSFTGRLFGVTTAYQLLELARPTHPLFRQLLTKAPGTYHHSIIVSNMAERAAEAIGADALLTRVGSYYHDIGKTTRPYYFVENQTDIGNPHDKLDPRTSADIIISHTLEGVELGRKYHLPEHILDFISEHHGTTMVTYFYRRATQLDDAEVDENAFRYPGPKPRTRETAIVMLADSVEAWTRASHPATAADLERGTRQIISNRLVSGQLSDCDLTLKDLDAIREAFVTVLRGVYHPRIQYPTATSRSNGRGTK